MDLKAYDADHLAELVEANSSAPDWVSGDVIDRIVEYAQQRAAARDEQSSLDADQTECIITTDWQNFTDDWGFSSGSANQVAIGTYNSGAGSKADLFENAEILQTQWLRSGDGRSKQAAEYEDGSDYDGKLGEMWIPHAAQDYICIIELTGELIHGEPELSEAM